MLDVDSTSKRIASRARLARENAGLSQGQAALKLGIARSSLTEAEAGNRKISAAELSLMVDIYGVAITWLAGRDGDEHDPERDQIEFAARELARLGPEDLQTVIQLVKSIRAKDR
jgi:transcriptional regulator with XRE-family HTH domain